MKPETDFVAERTLAQHCEGLIRRGPDIEVLAQNFAYRLATHLRIALEPLLPVDRPLITVTVPIPATRAVDQCRADMGLAAECVFDTANGASLGAIIDGRAIVQLVDRCFGGMGSSKDPAPTAFSPAARLIAARIEQLLASALASALGLEADTALTARTRDENFVLTAPFAGERPVIELAMSIVEPDRAVWRIVVIIPLDMTARLLGPGTSRTRTTVGPGPANPWNDLPLDLTAVLVEMAIPIGAIANVEVGSVIPVSIARQVRLYVGERTLAHGAIGQVDNALALRIDCKHDPLQSN